MISRTHHVKNKYIIYTLFIHLSVYVPWIQAGPMSTERLFLSGSATSTEAIVFFKVLGVGSLGWSGERGGTSYTEQGLQGLLNLW